MGTEGNWRSGLMRRQPWFISYRLDITSSRSEHFLTGRKRLRGTLIPGEETLGQDQPGGVVAFS